MATCDELATQLSGLQSQLAKLQAEQDDPEGTCAALGLTDDACILYLKSLGGKIASVQTQITGVQQQQQAQGCLNPPPPPVVTYELIDLGTLAVDGKAFDSRATAINSTGQVVGYAGGANGLAYSHAYLWSASTDMQDLGTLGRHESLAVDINDAGQVAGMVDDGAGQVHAYLWSASTGMRDLGALDSFDNSEATAINNAGQVVGSSYMGSDPLGRHAFLWSASTGMQDLGMLGGWGCYVNDINDLGQVVGGARFTPNGYRHAFLWSASTGMQDLGTLGGSESEAIAINNLGQVVGWANGANGETLVFLWSASTGMQLIDLPGQNGAITVLDINEVSQIIGMSNFPVSGVPTTTHAFVWSASTGMLDLNSLLPADTSWVLRAARGINGSGQVVGGGSYTGPFDEHAWLLRKHQS